MSSPTPPLPPEPPLSAAEIAAAAAAFLVLIGPWLAVILPAVFPRPGIIDPFGVLSAASSWAQTIRNWLGQQVTPRLRAPFEQKFGKERGRVIFDQQADTRQYLTTVANLLSHVPDEVFGKIRDVLQKASDAGTPTPDVADQIRTILLDAGQPYWTNRATVIARTELKRANSAGNFHSYVALAEREGLEFIKTWLDSDDNRVRPAHVDTDGQRRRLMEPFSVGIDGGPKFPAMYPLDPALPAALSIQCRCDMLIEEAGERMTDMTNRGFKNPPPGAR